MIRQTSLIVFTLFGLVSSYESAESLKERFIKEMHNPINIKETISRIYQKPNVDANMYAMSSNFNAEKFIGAIADGLDGVSNLNIPSPNISEACLTQFMYFANQLRNNRSQWAIEGEFHNVFLED
jgi:hypothetical protein